MRGVSVMEDVEDIRARGLALSGLEELMFVGPKPLWWLSFVDPDLGIPPEEQVPGGPSFLGVAIVEAAGAIGAVRRAHELKINPGGEVACAGPFERESWDPSWWNRLLSKTELDGMGA
jgi:hypothetical protein